MRYGRAGYLRGGLVVAVAAVLGMAASGCSSSSGSRPAESSAKPSPSGSAPSSAAALPGAGSASAGSPGSPGSPGTAGTDSVDTTNALARQTLIPPARPEAKVDVAVLSLKSDGNGKTMTLRVALTPHNVPPTYGNGTISAYDLLNRTAQQPFLIDRTNLKRYGVVQGGGRQLGSDLATTVTVDGRPMVLYTTFALPQDGTSSIEVWVADYWPPFAGVPIQR